MSFNAASLELMAAKGLSIADVVEIAKAMESRSSAAERQKRYRDNKRDVTRDVTPSPNPPLDDIYSNPPVSSPSEAKASSGAPSKPKRVTKTKLPADWQPEPLTSETQAWDEVQAWQPGRMERELSKFREHHTSRGNRMDCWQAAWRGWILKSRDFSNGNGHNRDEYGTDSATAIALAKFNEHLGGGDGACEMHGAGSAGFDDGRRPLGLDFRGG